MDDIAVPQDHVKVIVKVILANRGLWTPQK